MVTHLLVRQWAGANPGPWFWNPCGEEGSWTISLFLKTLASVSRKKWLIEFDFPDRGQFKYHLSWLFSMKNKRQEGLCYAAILLSALQTGGIWGLWAVHWNKFQVAYLCFPSDSGCRTQPGRKWKDIAMRQEFGQSRLSGWEWKRDQEHTLGETDAF